MSANYLLKPNFHGRYWLAGWLFLFSLVIAILATQYSAAHLNLSLNTLYTAIVSPEQVSRLESIAVDARFPRAVMAWLVGACLAMAGVLLQALYRNPLADPSITGVTQGAITAVVVWQTFFPSTDPDTIIWKSILVALLGSLLSTALTWISARPDKGGGTMRMLFMGIMIGGIFGAITTISLLHNSENIQAITSWLSGSLSNANWQSVAIASTGLIIVMPLLIWSISAANLLQLGNELSRGCGLAHPWGIAAVLACACLLTATAVCTVGGIGFVGMIAPHLVRWLVGTNIKVLLPTAAMAGGILVLITDTLARNIRSDVLEQITGLKLANASLPVGIYLTLLGGLMFLFILRRVKT